ncbi:MAG: hypothetical protein RL211_958 [Pseudomonadota bacterium]
MTMALAQARSAADAGEVPVGAVVVKDGSVIATGHNESIGRHDPTAHAEIMALRAAALVLGNYRLDGCELFVTLEPCPMCSGAILHSRLNRIVYGATEPKTGAAGSVTNLFENRRLNHQTQVLGGVLAAECAAVVHEFFRNRRVEARRACSPLREDAVRTPNERFTDLQEYPWKPRYISNLPSLAGLRLHYLDEGARDASLTWLCLHGNLAWSYLYRKMIPIFLAAGFRIVAPDLIGFGKSDKPKKDTAHHFLWHRQILLELVERLSLRNVVLVVQDWGGVLGLTLPMASPDRYRGLLIMNTWLGTHDIPLSCGYLNLREMCAKYPELDVARLIAQVNPPLSEPECAAYNAPFPGHGHQAALRAFAAMEPQFPDSDGADLSRMARLFWSDHWQGQTLMAAGLQDPLANLSAMQNLRQLIRGCPPIMEVPQAGHFVQEHGESIAQAAVVHFRPA